MMSSQNDHQTFSQARWTALFMACLAGGLLFGIILRSKPVAGVNDGSRWDTVWSLLHGHGYVIDEAPYSTIDKIRRDGHFYSSKPPLMPTCLAGVAWLLRALSGADVPEKDYVVIRLILGLVNIIPFGLMIVLYGRLLERFELAAGAYVFCIGAAAFGTYLTAYSVTLNNHTQAAWAVFFALYALSRIYYDDQQEWYYFTACGLSVAWAVANEMVAMVFALAVMALLCRKNLMSTLKFFLPPAALVGVAFMYTTYVSTGGLLPYYFFFKTDYYQYEGSYWRQPVGIDAADEPKWFYLFNLIGGHHGIFSLSPIFLISLIGLIRSPKKLADLQRVGAILTVLMLAFYTVKTNNYGGVCQGARWLLWLIPFWLISLASAVKQNFESRLFRIFALGCLLVSAISVGHALSGSGPWTPSWLQIFMHDRYWISY